MTDAASAQLPATANFINPETMHTPTGYTHVVEVTAGRPVYIAGQVALDPAGVLVGPGDIRAQARQVFDNLQAALQAVGASFDQVVKLTYYLVDATKLPWFARSATSTSIPSSHRPAPPSRSGGWSAMTCSSRSKRSRRSPRSSL
jgi:enamine deaminase RidA (YjgF/YER057c/UK114 family)